MNRLFPRISVFVLLAGVTALTACKNTPTQPHVPACLIAPTQAQTTAKDVESGDTPLLPVAPANAHGDDVVGSWSIIADDDNNQGC